ncbi:MAG: hypothetical protein RL748_1983 [Pseudomonadota bacterium]|jgi:hypothetical protein
MPEDHHEPWELDAEAQARGRWKSLLISLKAALSPKKRDVLTLCVAIEHELGLRPVVTASSTMPRFPDEIIKLLADYNNHHANRIGCFVFGLERALACVPCVWLSYVGRVGRANFDPVELGACAGICRRFADTPEEHRQITGIIHWVLQCMLGQYPIPEFREHPQRGDSTLTVSITQKIEAIQLNWKKLGLRPVVNSDTVLRWTDTENWVAWVRLADMRTGKITKQSCLKLKSSGQFQLIRL